MSTAATDRPPRPHPAVETAFLAPEAVLWDARHRQVHHLNPSASAVWLCVDGELTADQITAELSEIFETPREAIRPDVDKALADFVRLGLLDVNVESGDEESPTDHGDAEDEEHDPHDEPAWEAPADEGVVILARPPDP